MSWSSSSPQIWWAANCSRRDSTPSPCLRLPGWLFWAAILMEPRLKPAVNWELRCKAPGGSATRGIQGAGSCTVLGSLDRHDSPRNGCNPPSSLKPPKKCSQKCSYFRGLGPWNYLQILSPGSSLDGLGPAPCLQRSVQVDRLQTSVARTPCDACGHGGSLRATEL